MHGDNWWSWYWIHTHGEASNPARTRVGPGLAYRASFVEGPIFRIDSNVDPVPVTVDGWGEHRTPVAFGADQFPGSATVTPRLIESWGRAYRHRFRSWSDGGDMSHTIDVPRDTDTTLTLTLDTEYRLTTRAWQDWWNEILTTPSSADGFYSEGTEVRLLASARPPAKFIGWNGDVAGRDAAALVVMDDGKLAEAVFALDATELQPGVPVQVSLGWNGNDPDFERYYVEIPPETSELQVEFSTRTATTGVEAGLFLAPQDIWPNSVHHDNADRVLRDGAVTVTVPRPSTRWPAAYFILIRAAESVGAGARTLEGSLVARVNRDGGRNRAPEIVAVLEDRTLAASDRALVMDIARAFRDPDGDALSYTAVSSAETVAAVNAWGSTVTVTPVGAGATTITVTVTDVGGSNTSAMQRFTVTVPDCRRFTDHPLQPGATPLKAVHFLQLRACIEVLRSRARLSTLRWTDARLTAGVTPIRAVHLTELRAALDEAYAAAGRTRPRYTDAVLTQGGTGIKALHVMELRNAVLALEF